MDLTFALAAIGAATGISSAAIELVRFVRERRAFRVNFTVSTKIDSVPLASVTVLNRSTVGHYIKEAGFVAQRKQLELLNADDTVKETFEAEIRYVMAESEFLEAGEFRAFAGVPDPIEQAIFIDKPIRAYAVDSRNRWHWGGAGPVFRLMFGEQMPLDDEPGDVKALFDPHPELLPEQVVPAWRVWRKRELRSPKAYRFGQHKNESGKVVVKGRVLPDPES